MNFQLILLSITFRVANAIIGGEIADEGTFKYQVSIQEDHIHTCSGAVLDEWRILTVATCVETFPKDFYTVYAGSVIQDNKNLPIHSVEGIHVHPEYDTDSDNENNWLEYRSNNLAILILREPLDLGEHIQRVTLPTEEILPYCSFCKVAGWGLIGKRLKWTFQTIYRPQICKTMDAKHRQNEFCAVDPSEFTHLEEGDEGSPLICDGTAVGIHIPSIIDAGYPLFFAKTFSFLDFINGIQKVIPLESPGLSAE